MCNGIKIVWLGCEKHIQNEPKNDRNTAILVLWNNLGSVMTFHISRFEKYDLNGGARYAFAGYTSVYMFFAYPDLQRARIR